MASIRSMETTQRWTVGHLATSIEAVRSGYGIAWLPEEKIRRELEAGTLKALPLREGGELFAELYLIFADREHAGPRHAAPRRDHARGGGRRMQALRATSVTFPFATIPLQEELQLQYSPP